MGLYIRKNKEIDINITYEINTQLSLLCLIYLGNLDDLKN